jgi:phage tail sheath protein FI
MSSVYKVPGVYPKEMVVGPPPRLATGIPGFVGYVVPQPLMSLPSRPIALRRRDDFDATFGKFPDSARPQSYLAEAVAGFFLNGGVCCYVAAVEWAKGKNSAEKQKDLTEALESLGQIDEMDLVAVPDAMTIYATADADSTVSTLDQQAVLAVQLEMIRHCQEFDGRLALLDPLPGTDQAAVISQRNILSQSASSINAAFYYPWLRIAGGLSADGPERATQGLFIPPSGHVAGIIARSDASSGFYKSPANEAILGVQDLEVDISFEMQAQLNPLGINCLRAFPGRGIRVWGARTLSGDRNWQYISIRRLFLTLHRWVNLNMAWVNFEPNTMMLWTRIERELSTYLTELWRAGAIKGEKAADAFYIKCDAETNPPASRDAGQTITEIGLAPTQPAEFVAVRVVLHTGVEPR